MLHELSSHAFRTALAKCSLGNRIYSTMSSPPSYFLLSQLSMINNESKHCSTAASLLCSMANGKYPRKCLPSYRLTRLLELRFNAKFSNITRHNECSLD